MTDTISGIIETYYINTNHYSWKTGLPMEFIWLISSSTLVALISYPEPLYKYGIPIPPREYDLVFDAIPSDVVMLLRTSSI